MTFLSVLALTVTLTLSHGFVGYDCNDHLSTTIYSAIDAPKCSPPNLQWTSTHIPTVSILQVPLVDDIAVFVIQARTKSVSYYCSYERHFMPLLVPNNFMDMSPLFVSSPTALSILHAAQHGEKFQGKYVKFGEWVSFHNSNDVDEEGFCKSWKSKGVITITAYSVRGVTAQVHYTQKGEPSHVSVWGERVGLVSVRNTASLKDGSVVVGTEDLVPRCELELIYSGPGEYVLTKENQLFLVVDSIATGLLIGGKSEVCGVPVSTTSANSVLVTNQTVPGKTVRKKLETVHWSAYIQSIVQYEALHLTKQMAGSDTVLSANQCELERMVYSNILFGAKTDPDHTGLRIMGEPGWSVRIAGAAVHIFKCSPVPLRVAPQASCYSRIPVATSNTSIIKFLDPSSYSLYSNSTSLDCSDPQNPFFRIRDSWYKLTPDLHQVPPPLPLPSRLELLNATQLTPLGGLYPHEVLAEAEEKMGYAEKVDRANVALVENYYDLGTGEDSMDSLSYSQTSFPSVHIASYLSHSVMGLWLIGLTIWVFYISRGVNRVAVTVGTGPEAVPLHAL